MTPVEVVALVRYVAAGCPSMRIEDNTPDVWFDAGLSTVDPTDAKAAVVELLQTQTYISLADIIRTTGSITDRRVAHEATTAWRQSVEDEIKAIDATPAEPFDFEALKARLRAGAISAGHVVPKVDRRHPDTRRAEAAAELEALRKQAPPEADPA